MSDLRSPGMTGICITFASQQLVRLTGELHPIAIVFSATVSPAISMVCETQHTGMACIKMNSFLCVTKDNQVQDCLSAFTLEGLMSYVTKVSRKLSVFSIFFSFKCLRFAMSLPEHDPYEARSISPYERGSFPTARDR